MKSGTWNVARRSALALAVLGAVAVMTLLGVGPASGAVAWSDVTEAEADVTAAQRALAAVENELAALEDERTNLFDAITRLEERGDEIAAQAEEEGATIRDRIARMYMTAGSGSTRVGVVDVIGFVTRVAYLGAISERDQELVAQFALTVSDLELLRVTAEERLVGNASDSVRVSESVGARQADVRAAQSRLAEVRADWEVFQAEQRAAEEAELRRQEAMRPVGAPGTSPPTTAAPGGGSSGSTVTTTTIPWSPSAGVAQWRSLVTQVFTNWGLHTTSCETRNGIQFCVGPQIENALKVMQCESTGNPMAVNPSSGTSGLFQNHPLYWQSRVNNIRTHHSDKAPNLPADASIFNPEYNITVAAYLVWDSKEILLGRRGGGSIGGHPWPEFNFEMYYTGHSNGYNGPRAYGYSVSGKGPQPWGHWVGCGSTKPVNALGDSGIPWVWPAGQNLYDSGWIHPWAQQQSPP